MEEGIIIIEDYSKITSNQEVIDLLKERERIEQKIFEIDKMALVHYELVKLNSD